VPRLEKEVETLAQQCLRVTNERDQLRADVDRYVAELAAERQARLTDIEDQRRREARLSAIEELLGQLKTNESVDASPGQD